MEAVTSTLIGEAVKILYIVGVMFEVYRIPRKALAGVEENCVVDVRPFSTVVMAARPFPDYLIPKVCGAEGGIHQ